MSKELAKKEKADLPAEMYEMFEGDSGAGFEETDQSSYAIPFLSVLQSGSPQCKKSDGEYIKGAEEGMLFNNVTKQIFSGDDGVLVVPCHYTRTFNEWHPRNEGGGLVASHDVAEGEELLARCTKGEKGENVTPYGTHLNDTRNHFMLLVKDGGEYEPVFMPLSSTQITPSRRWMTVMNNMRINGKQAPMFSQIYRIKTVPRSNEQGSWYVIDVTHEKQVDSIELYKAAKEFRELVRSGAAKPVEEGSREDNTKEEVPY